MAPEPPDPHDAALAMIADLRAILDGMTYPHPEFRGMTYSVGAVFARSFEAMVTTVAAHAEVVRDA